MAIQRFKEAFHAGSFAALDRSPRLTHMNNAGIAPISKPAYDALTHWSKRLFEEGIHCITDAISEVENTRADLAALLGADAAGIAFFQSTAQAISQVALGFPFQAGDEILVWDQEYPSNLYPWREAAERSGARLILVDSKGSALMTPTEAIAEKISPRTRMIAFSWVQFRTGAIADVQGIVELARANGIYTCADIIQGAGLLPFDFTASGLDFACGGSHKWMTSPMGCGYLLMRSSHLEMLRPLALGAFSVKGPDAPADLNAPFQNDAHRFEPGAKGLLELFALGASLRLIRSVGVESIAQEAEFLARKLAHGLRERGYLVHSPHGMHHRGAIVNFSPSEQACFKTVKEVEHVLQQARVSFALRAPGVRFAPHAFNTEIEIESVLSLLE